jgi:hypothetical protein
MDVGQGDAHRLICEVLLPDRNVFLLDTNFLQPPMAIRASFIPFSIPFTSADMPTRLETPRMIPSMVRRERNLFAQISLKPTAMALSQ